MTLIMWQDHAPFKAVWNDRMNAEFPQGLNASALARQVSALSMPTVEIMNTTSLLTDVGTGGGGSEQDTATA